MGLGTAKSAEITTLKSVKGEGKKVTKLREFLDIFSAPIKVLNPL